MFLYEFSWDEGGGEYGNIYIVADSEETARKAIKEKTNFKFGVFLQSRVEPGTPITLVME